MACRSFNFAIVCLVLATIQSPATALISSPEVNSPYAKAILVSKNQCALAINSFCFINSYLVTR
ncbi:unnamed protein product [Thlaspi arvense]|uniref:Uncharacterized protein n=1 Tax=Thlaspi arvense TaxID=13288 RepID=A0AAU9RX28_THLAR|nr:unnamed protein product [Thlaspi arvense]